MNKLDKLIEFIDDDMTKRNEDSHIKGLIKGTCVALLCATAIIKKIKEIKEGRNE